MNITSLDIPEKLRSKRKDLKLSLQQVADATGFSVSYLSQIERGLTQPSVSSLVQMANFLEIPLTQLFTTPSTPEGGISRHQDRNEYSINLANGATYSPISIGSGALQLSSMITELPVGFRFEEKVVQHEGEEIFYVLSGEINLTLGDKVHKIVAGDAAHFNSQMPHGIENGGDEIARFLWVSTMKTYRDGSELLNPHAINSVSAEKQQTSKMLDFDVWNELLKKFFERAGIKLFTVMRFDEATQLSRRFYSSDPVNYPVAGTKPMTDNRWKEIVLDNQEIFIGNTLAELDEVFPDAELIGSLGLGSCTNIPVIEQGKILGTLNLLREEGGLTKSVMETLKTIISKYHEELVVELKKEKL